MKIDNQLSFVPNGVIFLNIVQCVNFCLGNSKELRVSIITRSNASNLLQSIRTLYTFAIEEMKFPSSEHQSE